MTRDVIHRRKILVLFLALAAASMTLFWPGSTSKADTGSQFSSGNFVNGTRENLVATPSGLSLSKYVPAEERGLVMDLGPPGSPDSDRAFLPFVMQDSDGSFKMWYTGYDGTRNRLLYANSTDGLRWTKQGVAIDIFQPPLMLDGVTGGSVLKEAGTYHMWFTGTSWGVGPAGYTDRIYHTESPDARNWSSPTLALDFGASGMWDSWYVLYPSVLRDANDVLRMYYTGGDCAPPNCLGFGIGLATSTNTSSVFDRWSGNPLLRQGAPSTWDADGYAGTSIGYPAWRLYTEGSQAQHFTIGVASSNDGYNWRFEGDQPLLRPNTSQAWESVGVGGPSLVESLGWLYYSGSNGYNWRVGLAQLNPDGYRPEGTYTSEVFDSQKAGTSWLTIEWNATIPEGTSLTFAVRSGDSSIPSAGWSPWQTIFATGDAIPLPRTQYIQYRAAFSTNSLVATPELHSVAINFRVNRAPMSQPLGPAGAWMNTTKPVVQWSVSDSEADTQKAFEVQLSRDASFASVNVDSGIVASSDHVWQTPTLSQGDWYWRVRVQDAYGAWSDWTVSSLRVDVDRPTVRLTSPASSSQITTSGPEILWVASDSGSGIEHFDVIVDNGASFKMDGTASGTVVSGLADGSHTIQVTAIDRAGNRATDTVTVTVDTNLFSASGPTHGYLTLTLALVGAGAIGFGIALMWRRKSARPPKSK